MHGQDETRLLGLGLDFLAQANDVRIHRARSGKTLVAPYFLEQTIAAERFPGMTQKVLKQIEFLGGKIERLTAARYLATAQIHFDIPKGVTVLLFRNCMGAAKDSLYPGQQFANRKRLGDVVVRSQLEAHHFVHFLSARGQHDDGNGCALGLELFADIQAAHAGHHDVEDDQVGFLRNGAFQAGNAVGCGDDFVSFVLEVIAQAGDHVGLIFDNQDFRHKLFTFPTRQASRLPLRGSWLCRRRAAGDCCRIYRQSDGELATLARSTIHDHVATVRLHDVTHQGKAQAAALGVVYQWIAHAIELLENLLLLLRWDANSVIDHFQLHCSVFAIEIHSDIFPILRILEGVVYQVDDRARHGLAIHSHRRNGVDLLLKGEAVLLDLIAIRFQRIPYQLPHVGVTEVVFFAAGLDAREI